MPIVSNDFSDIVYNRRSIRNFDTSVKIPREELLEILDKNRYSPIISEHATLAFCRR